jgi:hypothetical protein
MNISVFAGKVTWIKEAETDSRPLTFGIAVNNGKDREGNLLILWVKVVAWAGQKEFVERWLRKGANVTVSGRINADPKTGNPRAWVNPSGDAQTALEVNLLNLTLHAWPSDLVEDTDEETPVRESDLDDIPF